MRSIFDVIMQTCTHMETLLFAGTAICSSRLQLSFELLLGNRGWNVVEHLRPLPRMHTLDLRYTFPYTAKQLKPLSDLFPQLRKLSLGNLVQLVL
jgi:hypothetical protein